MNFQYPQDGAWKTWLWLGARSFLLKPTVLMVFLAKSLLLFFCELKFGLISNALVLILICVCWVLASYLLVRSNKILNTQTSLKNYLHGTVKFTFLCLTLSVVEFFLALTPLFSALSLELSIADEVETNWNITFSFNVTSLIAAVLFMLSIILVLRPKTPLFSQSSDSFYHLVKALVCTGSNFTSIGFCIVIPVILATRIIEIGSITIWGAIALTLFCSFWSNVQYHAYCDIFNTPDEEPVVAGVQPTAA